MTKLLNGSYMIVMTLATGLQMVFEERGDPEARAREIKGILESKGVLHLTEKEANPLIGGGDAMENIVLFRSEVIGMVNVMPKDLFISLQERRKLLQMPGPQQGQNGRM